MMPISSPDAKSVIAAGELSALGKWCDLDWEMNYKNTTASARYFKLTDKQVAFVGFLHGTAMGVVEQSLKTTIARLHQKQRSRKS